MQASPSQAKEPVIDDSARSAAQSRWRPDPRDFHPFLRLARLLENLEPGRSPCRDGSPINLAVGDPQRPAPSMVAETIARFPNDWSRYPPFRGPADFRLASIEWLNRRYALPNDWLDPERHLLPMPGSREGLFFATLATVTLGAGNGRNAVLIPAPGYHVYVGGAVAAGAEAVFVPATRANGFLPDLEATDPAILDRAAIAFVCSPSNPEGAACDIGRWQQLISLARRHGFALVADECYADIYTDAAPPGLLQVARQSGAGLEGLLSIHSLSKRSSAAGLRCGFAAGDPALIDAIDAFFRYGGAGSPTPILHAGAALWRDDSHAAQNRAFYARLFTIAERILDGRFGWRKPAGGFFLWLEVGDGETAARKLWSEAGLRVLPGAYMCPGSTASGANPGAAFIRVALVYDEATTEAALQRLVEVLDGSG